ncbi:YciI family protein [Streptomyces antarcticus]|uniref:YciI family protein n=1 Tax=Streptomyces antarcticus TaxID=2996458 RepID=UPI00226D5BBD|nr:MULTISPECIES: YciI family protein [unclassified Streptomyces]MCY0942937.1 YciI family protein [Streptomyces sp. H34-AA3]MCY0953016.1 YciI family protein [Streptomyces sp. H27-S2]MCZ4083103.1 YciI family protein [Streptomyces sp. H34-S5]
MKFLLIMHMNPVVWEALSADQQQEVFDGHDSFQQVIGKSGEMVGTKALDFPANTTTVKVRDGATETATGAYVPGEAFLCGYYVVDVASKERAVELAALIPDAKLTAVEVREVVHEAGAE